MKPTLQHRLEYGLARTIEAGLDALSPAAADRLGALLGRLLYSPLGVRRKVVESNLARAFPEADPTWRAEVARAAYRHLGREAVAMVRLAALGRDWVNSVVEIPDEDWRAFEEALAEGKGVILATGHYGNWELAAAAVAARGVPVEAVIKRIRNPLLNRRIEEARRGMGIDLVDVRRANSRVPRALAAGRSVGIVSDQDARRAGIFVPFFGHPASTARGPALFALRTGAPIFAAACRRLPDGRYLLSGPRLRVERTGSLDEDVARLTATIAAHLEAEIRKDPTQYFWFHKRWKTRPPEEPVSGDPGTIAHGGPGRDPSREPASQGRPEGHAV